jgi:hypothetical protein
MHHIIKLFRSTTSRYFWLDQAFYLSLALVYLGAWMFQHLSK